MEENKVPGFDLDIERRTEPLVKDIMDVFKKHKATMGDALSSLTSVLALSIANAHDPEDALESVIAALPQIVAMYPKEN